MKNKNRNTSKEQSVCMEAIFEKAMNKYFDSICLVSQQSTKEYFKHTEKRLYAYPALLANIQEYDNDIEDLKHEYSLPGSQKSKDIARMQSSGIRLTPDEILEGKIHAIEKKKNLDLIEIREIERALDFIATEPYFQIVTLKYFHKKTDREIAEEINCDETTVRRNKNRLLSQIMVKLYGAAGL